MLVSCPNCGIAMESPGVRPGDRYTCGVCLHVFAAALSAEPPGRYRYKFSARNFDWPRMCCCCGGPDPMNAFRANSTRTTGVKVLKSETKYFDFPLCERCRLWIAAMADVPPEPKPLPPEPIERITHSFHETVPADLPVPPSPRCPDLPDIVPVPDFSSWEPQLPPVRPPRPFRRRLDGLQSWGLVFTATTAGLMLLGTVYEIAVGRVLAIVFGIFAATFGSLAIWLYTLERDRWQVEEDRWVDAEDARVGRETLEREWAVERAREAERQRYEKYNAWAMAERHRLLDGHASDICEWEAMRDDMLAADEAARTLARVERERRLADRRRVREFKELQHSKSVEFVQAKAAAAEAMRPARCCHPEPVRYLGWYGSVHTFVFTCRAFADAFTQANIDKLQPS